MIQLEILDAEGKKRLLDTLENTQLQIESTSPLFDDDDKEDLFSYPIELPWTDNNRSALGFPEVLTTITDGNRPYWVVNVLYDGIPELTGAKLTLLQVKGQVDGIVGSYIMSISGGASLYGTLIADKTLKDLKLGGTINIPSNQSSRQFAFNVTTGSISQYPYIAFAPVRRENYIDKDRQDYTVEYLYDDTVNSIVRSSLYPGGWVFGSLDQSSVTATISGWAAFPGSPYYKGHRTVPFFQMMFVLRKCFEEFGYIPYGDFFAHPDYKFIYLDNNYGIEVYNNNNTDINRAIKPQNHVPKVTIAEFLNAIKKTFNLHYNIQDGKKVEIVFKDKILQSSEVVDLTDTVSNYYESEIPEQAENGYKYQFNWPADDELPASTFKEIDTGLIKYKAVAPPFNISAAKEGEYAYASKYNYLYIVFQLSSFTGTPAPALGLHCEALIPIKIGNGKKLVELKMPPLASWPSIDSSIAYGVSGVFSISPIFGQSGTIQKCWCRQKGTYYNDKGTLVENDFGLRMFYIKKRNYPFLNVGYVYPDAVNVPTSFIHSIDPWQGWRLTGTSLSLYAEDGLYAKHHQLWNEFVDKSKKVSFFITKKSTLTNAIPFDKKIRIGNSLYIAAKVNANSGRNDLIEAIMYRVL